jgi:hypothetical protein
LGEGEEVSFFRFGGEEEGGEGKRKKKWKEGREKGRRFFFEEKQTYTYVYYSSRITREAAEGNEVRMKK